MKPLKIKVCSECFALIPAEKEIEHREWHYGIKRTVHTLEHEIAIEKSL